ncbi:MAG: aldolase [Calditrichaeota bacterium]|nr:aldolase [Calditrichota bacterium]
MNKSQKLFSILREKRLIALLTPESVEQCISAYEILYEYDVILEIAFRSQIALDGIKGIIAKYPKALLLAGTVMTRKQAEESIDAGVAGVVSADYIPEVVEVCVKHDVMCAPGGLSDAGKQLVRKAALYDCELNVLREKYPHQWVYKLFPAIAGAHSNVDFVKAWRGPYKDLSIIYTGGVSIENLKELSSADPTGIFCGSALTKSIDDPEQMRRDVEKWIDATKLTSTGKFQSESVNEMAEDFEKWVETNGTSSMNSLSKLISNQAPAKVVTLGEIMLRLSPPEPLRFVQTTSFNSTFGGAEANTAVAFANYGLNSSFVTVLPSHEIGQSAVNSLRAYGVDTKYILRKGNRVGIYFLEYGASQRPSKVIYDRANSAISNIKPGQINWDSIFEGATWFHWSGITPALSNSAAKVTREALIAAKKHGVKVSVDLNFRKKLWSEGRAQAVMSELMEYVDVCIGNEEDAEKTFGIRAKATDVDSGKLNEAGYHEVARRMVEKFGFEKVAITLRESISASDNNWSACLFNGNEFMLSKKYPIHIVDRVGGGDSFSSGLVYAVISGKSDKDALEFGVAASCLKQTIHGDFNLVSVEEIEKLARGGSSGRIQR